MKIALVCIAKNEDNYIEEWIEYNLKLGFDHIFIYANDWNFKTDNKKVSVFNISGPSSQCKAYNDFKKNKSYGYSWAAFFDVDEFLVLNRHTNIKDFLSDYEDCNAIGVNWAMFGNNDHDKVINNNYKVLDRFTKRAEDNYEVNSHVKTIVKLPCSKYQHVHSPQCDWYNLKKEKRSGSFNTSVDFSVAQLNHYFTKSDEELKEKCKRGRADNNQGRSFESHKIYLKLNNVEDLKALKFMNK